MPVFDSVQGFYFMGQREKVILLLDGSNFYHRLKELEIEDLLSFNYQKFTEWLAEEQRIVEREYFIGAIREEIGNLKSKELMSAQTKLFTNLKKQNWKILLGYLLKIGDKYHEKGVDVKIAVEMLIGAYENLYDRVILISSDTDLLPAIEKVKKLGKKIEYVGFSHKPSFAMIRHASLTKLLTKKDLTPFFTNIEKIEEK